MNLIHAYKNSSRKVRILTVLVLLYLLYALLGFFLAPVIVRDQGKAILADLTGREVHIGEVRINPLTLTLNIDEFAIRDEQTQVLTGFQQLHINFQMSSLFRRQWYFDRILLDGFTLRAQRNPGDRFNFSDIIEHINARSAAQADNEPAPDPDSSGQIPSVAIAQLQLSNGELRYTEASGETAEQIALPVNFTINDFATRAEKDNHNQYSLHIEGPGPESGALDWQGHFELNPLSASGKLAINRIDLSSFARLFAHQVRFSVPSGRLDLDLNYDFSSEPQPRLRISNGELLLSELQFQSPQQPQPSVTLAAIQLSGIELDSQSQAVRIPIARIDTPQVSANLDSDGIDLVSLFTPLNASTEAGTATSPDSEAETETDTAWTLALDKLSVNGAQATLLDRTVANAPALVIDQGELTLEQLVIGAESPFHWQGSANLLGQGRIQHRGEGQLLPQLALTLNANLADLPLAPLSPWLQAQAPLNIADGVLALEIDAEVSGEAPTVTASGDASLSKLNLQENSSPLLSAARIAVTGLALNSENQRLHINAIELDQLDMLNRVDSDGRDAATRITAGISPADSSARAESADSSPPWHISADQLRIRRSQLRHEDRSLSPQFQVGLYELAGTISELDSRPGQKVRIALDGKVDRYAPFSAKGSVVAEPLLVDLNVNLKNYEMTALTPFTGRYLGFAVEKGHLGVDATLDINKGQLKSKSAIEANQFFLGDSVASEEAISAPIKLGLAVLRDRSGKIGLPLDLSGDLNDPSVTVTGIVMRVLRNVVVRAATSPFSVLAGLAGGENLEAIPFSAGQAEPSADTLASLQTLAQVLKERPNLSIAITGSSNQQDRQALAEQALITELADPDSWPGLQSALDDRSMRRQVIRYFERQQDQDVESLLSEQDLNALDDDREARQRVLAEAAWQALVSNGANNLALASLNELARQRAANAKAVLVEQHGLEEARLYLQRPQADSDHAGLTLDLDSRS